VPPQRRVGVRSSSTFEGFVARVERDFPARFDVKRFLEKNGSSAEIRAERRAKVGAQSIRDQLQHAPLRYPLVEIYLVDNG
jgi:hypothetical protein